MIQTSQAFINAINQSSRQWRSRFLYNGTDTGANTKSLTVKGGSQPETAFNLCGIYGASFEAVIDTLDGFKWEDKIITPQLGLVLEDESVEWISLGVFTITEVKSAKYQTTIIGVGNLTANGGKAFTLPATQSVNAIISAITSEIGVTITLDASFDGTTVIEKSMAGLSIQETLQVIASVLGGFVADKYNGSIMIAPYPTTPTTTIDTTRMTQEPTFADYDNQITGVHVIVSPAFTDEDGQVVPAVEYQTTTPNTTIENPYMTAGAFDDFADAVVGLTWRTANVPIALGDPRYEATDMIAVTVNGETPATYNVPCFNFVHHFDGGLQTTVIAYGDSESLAKTEQGGVITRQLKEIQGDILRVDKAIVQTLEVGDHFFVGQDGHVHITEEPKDYTTGNNIYIDADSVDVRQGEVAVASFGENTQIGESDNTHIEMAFNSLKLIDKESNEFFVVEDLRNKQGVFTMTETFVGNGTKKDFNLTFLATDTDYTVTVDDVVAYPSKSTSKITFTTPPALNSEIVVTYDTESELVKAMTFGSRKTGSKKGAVSIAEGGNNEASGIYSHAEGYGTTASGHFSHAEGNNTTARGDYSHTEGLNTDASGLYSHAEGWGSSASRGAHAEGNNTTASNFSHAEGSYANASNGSHAEGYRTTASGDYSHAEGRDTTADGDYSHAEGYGCEARGQYAHAQNEGTQTSGSSQTALGKWNQADPTASVIIGNGSDKNNRSNALTIDWNGSVKTETRIHNFGGSNFICGTTDTSDIILWGNNAIKIGVGVTNSQDNKQFFLQARADELRLTNNTDSITLWQIKPDNYLAGESISFTENYVYYVGHITNSAKSLDFFIPLPRSATGLTCSLSLNASNGLSVRMGAGGYLNGTQYIDTTTSDYTITTSPSSLGVRVRITKSTAYSGAVNNMACSVAIAGTLTFS